MPYLSSHCSGHSPVSLISIQALLYCLEDITEVVTDKHINFFHQQKTKLTFNSLLFIIIDYRSLKIIIIEVIVSRKDGPGYVLRNKEVK